MWGTETFCRPSVELKIIVASCRTELCFYWNGEATVESILHANQALKFRWDVISDQLLQIPRLIFLPGAFPRVHSFFPSRHVNITFQFCTCNMREGRIPEQLLHLPFLVTNYRNVVIALGCILSFPLTGFEWKPPWPFPCVWGTETFCWPSVELKIIVASCGTELCF